ncbi:MAG: sigma-70 family RNA polymerase sigma factor [Bdellovibrionota bacterium]
MTPTHEETMTLLYARDPVFLANVFRDVNPYLLRVMAGRRIVGPEAEELIHQAWGTFFENLKKFEGRSTLRTFLCGILINKLREQKRSDAKLHLEEDVEMLFGRAFSPEGWWNVAPASPDRLIESRQTMTFIEECLEGLSEQQRSVFIMKEVEEDESEDICNVLDISVSHLRVLMFRAKEKLRQCLEGKLSV